ncbi:Uncharacterised protein [Bordetella pertussis]|nr:Uncharacterised protein [Bordetella pertussis]CFW48494.1 Uncharacterised protein [Bordetella pertussis]CPN55799.1 Uncharacterised protein [Bordetella pertussis]
MSWVLLKPCLGLASSTSGPMPTMPMGTKLSGS